MSINHDYDKYVDKYFDQTTINDYESSKPNIKETKKFIGKLRKIGDTKKQYVTNLYYLDTLEYSYDNTEVYSIYNDSDPVYSYYHSECSYCREHKEKVKTNPIVGFRIYPKGVKPNKTYEQRKLDWEQFR